MKLENRFTVPVPVDEAWKVLLDVPRIAPCMPGATLTGSEGDTFTGTVKVKVGPINLTYGGTATIVSRDEAAHVAVIQGSGKETRGTGTAKALITCRLVANGASTDVEVDTDLNVTGKPASFGRGVLADVSGKLVDQFAACLSEEIGAGTGQPAAPSPAAAELLRAEGGEPATGAGGPGIGGGETVSGAGPTPGASSMAASAATPASAPTRAARKPAEAIDLLETAGAPVLKRLAPLAAAVAALLLVLRRLRR
jgi:carbon monoxide dehydrogenase subunit G